MKVVFDKYLLNFRAHLGFYRLNPMFTKKKIA